MRPAAACSCDRLVLKGCYSHPLAQHGSYNGAPAKGAAHQLPNQPQRTATHAPACCECACSATDPRPTRCTQTTNRCNLGVNKKRDRYKPGRVGSCCSPLPICHAACRNQVTRRGVSCPAERCVCARHLNPACAQNRRLVLHGCTAPTNNTAPASAPGVCATARPGHTGNQSGTPRMLRTTHI